MITPTKPAQKPKLSRKSAAIVRCALAMSEESRQRMNTATPQERADLEQRAREIIAKAAPKLPDKLRADGTLKKGAICAADDQYEGPNGTWIDCCNATVVGQPFDPKIHSPRRRSPLSQPKRAKKRPCTKAEHDLINLCNHNIGSDAKVAALRAHVAKAIAGYRAANRRAK